MGRGSAHGGQFFRVFEINGLDVGINRLERFAHTGGVARVGAVFKLSALPGAKTFCLVVGLRLLLGDGGGLALRNMQHRLRNGGNRLGRNSALFTVWATQPCREGLLSFACIAGHAAQRDVLAGDDRFVIDNMLPTLRLPSGGGRWGKRAATVDAIAIPVLNFALQVCWDVPSIGQGVFHPNLTCGLFR